MNVINITRAELTPEEKTAINVLANVECYYLTCEFCPVQNHKDRKCLRNQARRIQEQLKEE